MSKVYTHAKKFAVCYLIYIGNKEMTKRCFISYRKCPPSANVSEFLFSSFLGEIVVGYFHLICFSRLAASSLGEKTTRLYPSSFWRYEDKHDELFLHFKVISIFLILLKQEANNYLPEFILTTTRFDSSRTPDVTI